MLTLTKSDRHAPKALIKALFTQDTEEFLLENRLRLTYIKRRN